MTLKAKGNDRYQNYDESTLLSAYEQAPQRLKEAIDGLTDEEIHQHVLPGKWSIAEILIHLTDGEIIGACRIRQAYCEHKAEFPSYEEAEWAKLFNYQEQPMESIRINMELFSLLRKTTAAIFHKCTDLDWFKEGLHPAIGRMNLRGVLELYADHSERHLGQILERRNLMGKPSAMKLILEERLY